MPRKPPPKKARRAPRKTPVDEQVAAKAAEYQSPDIDHPPPREPDPEESYGERAVRSAYIEKAAQDYLLPRCKAGRPGVLTDEVIDAVCAQLRSVGSMKDAANRVGVHRDTLYEWIKKGRAEQDGPCRKLAEMVTEALADRRLECEAEMRAHGRGDWRALWAFMGSMDPERYAPRVNVHLERNYSRATHRLTRRFEDRPELLEEVLATIVGEFDLDGVDDFEEEETAPQHGGGEAVLSPDSDT